MRLLKTGKRWLLLAHRWLGIVLGLFFALWIGSGLVMLYVPFPRLSEAERLAHLTPIAWERVAIGPDTALAATGFAEAPAGFGLEMRGAEPVYRIAAADGTRATISASTGEKLGPVGADEARAIAGGRGSVETVARDQWTVTARYDRLRPFHKVALGDAAGTERYVSETTGELALDTTRFERGWNWVGAVVHWIYPTPLRARADLWHDVVVWISGIACLGAVSGMVLGIWRLRLRRRYPHGAVTPYRGMARWHHLFGLAGGLTLTSFIVSGWLSMNPNRWFSSPSPPAGWLAAYAGPGAAIGLDPTGVRNLATPATVAIRFTRIGGRWLVRASAAQTTRVARADGARLDEAEIVRAATGAVPASAPPAVERLTAYDRYWYPHHDERALPVLRLRFDDAAATWLHIDPATGEILNRLDRSGRVNRWLFSALHRLDLPVLIFNRPAWDAAQWILNALAAVIALTGLVIGWRRLRRPRPRSVKPAA
ncbi:MULTISPECIES: PepSY domain-containing protein [Methylobacterium]|uniref:PepSY domain-containing protein n=1 Tax=Methylobacterium thuringiense TaxID=1003091 RepID=A0ABQ4TJ77_9HYPH|nr:MULTISPECIES: PepSY domain-containing protein [Methylobacterium]TXN21337.1 PepSY domain-containing protein [Methylobacterium sp. WL9]GJE55318.1 hypothetical protein EKPJFOCH_1808 [Methylobacterium thuringiense]